MVKRALDILDFDIMVYKEVPVEYNLRTAVETTCDISRHLAWDTAHEAVFI